MAVVLQETDLRTGYLEAMSRVASSVTIVSTNGRSGRAGATVSSMVSVSADTDKPTLLICLQRNSSTAQAVLENGVFCANTLRADQESLARIFAGQTGELSETKFSSGDWGLTRSGIPRLGKALLALDCRVVGANRVGLHHLVLGEVDEITLGRPAPPLMYVNREYALPIPSQQGPVRQTAA